MRVPTAESITAWAPIVHQSPLATWVGDSKRILLGNAAAAELLEVEDAAALVNVPLPVTVASQQPVSEPVECEITGQRGGRVAVRLVSWWAVPGTCDARVYQAVRREPAAADADWLNWCETLSPGRHPVSHGDELRRGLLSSTADCIKILSCDARLLYMNLGGQKLMAVADPEKVKGADWLSFWKGEHRRQAEWAVSEARGGRVGRFTGLCPRLDGTHRWWDVVVSPLTDSRGKVTRLLSVSRDITEFKLAQRRESAEKEILERIAADRPLAETLDAICRLVEGNLENTVSCSILLAEAGGWLRVASSPSVPELSGMAVNWDELTDGATAGAALLAAAGARKWRSKEFRGLDHEIVGRIVVWIPDPGRDFDTAESEFEVPANLAAIACIRASTLRRLRDKRDRLSFISRAAPVGLYQMDEAGNWTFVNERHHQLTGLGLEQCSGEGWLQSVHPDDREAVRTAWLAARAADAEFTAEYRLMQSGEAGGGERWVIAHEAPAGATSGRLGTITDITDMKGAEQARAETASRFELLANNITQLCWMADASGWIFWYNERWYQYTGTTLEQMKGWGWRKVHHPDHVDRVVEKISHCWQTGEDWEDTFPLRGRDGEYRWFLSRAMPIRDQTGRVIRWFGTNTDITEQRNLERALHEQNKALQRSNEDLSKFAFFAGHDLQEPLRTITGFSQLALRDLKNHDPEKAGERLESVVEAVRRMSALIRDLLQYAQASAEPPASTGTVCADRVVDSVLETLSAAMQDAGARLTRGSLPELRCNEAQLAQVFQNLISNSLKYRRPGVPPRIHIHSEPTHGGYWRISVTDNGQGFAQENAAVIFEFLRRLHGRGVSGSGVGLAVCKAIIERAGGEIGAEGREGEGATFWFTLPAAA